MALLQCDVKSASLRKSTEFWALLPQDNKECVECRALLYLLHGRAGDAKDWIRYTNVERYAEKYGLAVIMPQGDLSFYTNQRHGAAYLAWITTELPALVKTMFRLPSVPEDTFIAGLSMGGYGALKSAFNRPELYAGCASFSAVTDIKWRIADTSKDDPGLGDLEAMFGAGLTVKEEDDLFALAPKAAKAPKKPRLYLSCGTEDIRYSQNRQLSELLKKEGYVHTWEEWPGDHDWDFWDESVKKALAFFFLRGDN
jgi:S-formylglutathione hydrolase FrmB